METISAAASLRPLPVIPIPSSPHSYRPRLRHCPHSPVPVITIPPKDLSGFPVPTNVNTYPQRIQSQKLIAGVMKSITGGVACVWRGLIYILCYSVVRRPATSPYVIRIAHNAPTG